MSMPTILDCNKKVRIYGLIRIGTKADKYDIPKGIYPVIYFEERSVQIPIDQDQPDWIYINRDDIDEWIKVENISLD